MTDTKNKPVLVLIELNENSNSYKRYVGKTLTNHVLAEYPLDRYSVDEFRVSPHNFYPTEKA